MQTEVQAGAPTPVVVVPGAPPLHRLASRCALATLGGALGVTTVSAPFVLDSRAVADGAFLVPLGLARALEARPLRSCVLLGGWALQVWFVLFTYRVRPPLAEDFVLWALPIALTTVGVVLGLHLGDRLEPRLAGWLRRRLHGPDEGPGEAGSPV